MFVKIGQLLSCKFGEKLFAVGLRQMHVKCRDTAQPYHRSDIFRVEVPPQKIDWAVEWIDYAPSDFTSPSTIGKLWADPEIISLTSSIRWNQIDGDVDRRSHIGSYAIDDCGRPLNICGRTGLRGRGVLGRWGPNHAADPIVTRFHNGHLQFVGISRRDTGEWAIPGGMVDAGEEVNQTLRREFLEEALDSMEHPELGFLWENGVELYRGYVDDRRNTDNAWIETVVVNFHDTSGVLDKVHLKAGDDAANVRWITVVRGEKLYASHGYFIKLLAQHHKIPF